MVLSSCTLCNPSYVNCNCLWFLVFPITVFTSSTWVPESMETCTWRLDASLTAHFSCTDKILVLPDTTSIKNGKQRSLLVFCHLAFRAFCTAIVGCLLALETCAGSPSFRVKQGICMPPVSSRSLCSTADFLENNLCWTKWERFQWPFLKSRQLILSVDACTFHCTAPTPTASVNRLRLQVERDEEATQDAGIYTRRKEKEIWIYFVRNFSDDQTTILVSLIKWPYREVTIAQEWSSYPTMCSRSMSEIYRPCPIKHRQCC